MRRKDGDWLKDTNSWLTSSQTTDKLCLSLVPSSWSRTAEASGSELGSCSAQQALSSGEERAQVKRKAVQKRSPKAFLGILSDSNRHPSPCVILMLELPKASPHLVKLSPSSKTMSAGGQFPQLSCHEATWPSHGNTPGPTSISLSSQPRCNLPWMVLWAFICCL